VNFGSVRCRQRHQQQGDEEDEGGFQNIVIPVGWMPPLSPL
jgi:hypothetical protein